MTPNLMPMGAAAASRALPPNPADLMPPLTQGPAPAAAAPPMPTGAPPAMPPSMPPPISMPPAGAAPMMPAPAPQPTPDQMFEVKLQSDGSSIYLLKGTDIVLGRNEPPKMPKSLQQPPVQ